MNAIAPPGPRRWQTSPWRSDVPPESPLVMPIQSFGACPGRYTAPASSPLNIGNRRLVMFTAVVALTFVSLGELIRVSTPGGIGLIEAILLALLLPLFTWIALSFCSAAAGFGALLARGSEPGLIAEIGRASCRERVCQYV